MDIEPSSAILGQIKIFFLIEYGNAELWIPKKSKNIFELTVNTERIHDMKKKN